MQLFVPALSLVALLMAGGQLSAPNSAGVAMGHPRFISFGIVRNNFHSVDLVSVLAKHLEGLNVISEYLDRGRVG
jgi:hypothetical protein